jgi:hypothetical protein
MSRAIVSVFAGGINRTSEPLRKLTSIARFSRLENIDVRINEQRR